MDVCLLSSAKMGREKVLDLAMDLLPIQLIVRVHSTFTMAEFYSRKQVDKPFLCRVINTHL